MSRSRTRPRATAAPRPAAAPPPAWAAHALALAPALVAGAALYAPVLGLFFAQDDVTFLARAAGLAPTPWSFARPLSEGVLWRALYAAFGLWPAPYHAVRLALHLGAAALVYAVAWRLQRARFAAGAAAFLFAVSSVGFTALHWASCIVEVSMTVLALGAFALHLSALERGSRARLWGAAALAGAAVLAKEAAIGLPAVFALAAGRPGSRFGLRRATAPVVAVFAALAGAFLATRAALPYGQYTGGDAYAFVLAPGALAGRLAQYLRWCLPAGPALREAADPGAPARLALTLGAFALVAYAIATQRRDGRHPAEIGALWFLVFLLPVLPLAHHAYLYYLYLPWAGACWLLASVARRVAAPWPAPARAALALGALAVVGGLEWGNVRAREAARLGPVPADKTVRESVLLGNAVEGLRAAQLPAGTGVGFLNPFPEEHAAAGGARGGAVRSYIPLEGALRGGEALRVFAPGTRYLGFARGVPPAEWDDATIFLFENDGTLLRVGSGPDAFRGLATLYTRLGRTGDADSLRRRADALAVAAAVPAGGAPATARELPAAHGKRQP